MVFYWIYLATGSASSHTNQKGGFLLAGGTVYCRRSAIAFLVNRTHCSSLWMGPTDDSIQIFVDQYVNNMRYFW